MVSAGPLDTSVGDLLTAEHPHARSPTLAALRVTVIEGPDQGKSFLIDPASPQRILIGTSPACGIRLSDMTISRRHAAVEPLGPRCRITDLGSTNGTFMNGVNVIEAIVHGGEILRCGGTTLR